MVSKLISIVLLACIGELIAVNVSSSSDLTFLFFSNNPIIIVLRLALALMIIIAMFGNLLRTTKLRYLFGAIGIFLIIIGSMGMFSNSIDYAWYPFLKIMDFMMLFLCGVVLCLYALPERLESKKQTYRILTKRGFTRALVRKGLLPRSRPAR